MHNANISLPNVYFVTVTSSFLAQPLHLHIAADFTGGVMRKLQRVCKDTLGFVPYRSNSVVKMRRFRLNDYVEQPQGLLEAYELAVNLGERDIAEKLLSRPQEVAELLAVGTYGEVSADAVWERLAAEVDRIAGE